MLYMGNHLSYKPRNDLCIFKTAKLESAFIELINTKMLNVIIDAIYRHHIMDLDEFNDIYLDSLPYKISKESISIFLLGEFNVDLLKYDHHIWTKEFLDSLYSHMFLPHIIQPARVTSNIKTLIDNIFSSILSPDSFSGNFTTTVCDHLPQFVITSIIFSNSPLGSKSNIYEGDWTNFYQENFILDYLAEDCRTILLERNKQA